MPNYDFDSTDIARVAEYFPDNFPIPTFAEMAERWPDRKGNNKTLYADISKSILFARAERIRREGPTRFHIQGDWMSDDGYIDNTNRPSRVIVYCDIDGRWWAEDNRFGPSPIKAVAWGNNAPMLVSALTAEEDEAGIMGWGGNFCPDDGELSRIGMQVETT